MSEEILEPTSPLVEETVETPVAETPAERVAEVAAAIEAEKAAEAEEPAESFGDAFAEFERTHSRKAESAADGPKPREVLKRPDWVSEVEESMR